MERSAPTLLTPSKIPSWHDRSVAFMLITSALSRRAPTVTGIDGTPTMPQRVTPTIAKCMPPQNPRTPVPLAIQHTRPADLSHLGASLLHHTALLIHIQTLPKAKEKDTTRWSSTTRQSQSIHLNRNLETIGLGAATSEVLFCQCQALCDA